MTRIGLSPTYAAAISVVPQQSPCTERELRELEKLQNEFDDAIDAYNDVKAFTDVNHHLYLDMLEKGEKWRNLQDRCYPPSGPLQLMPLKYIPFPNQQNRVAVNQPQGPARGWREFFTDPKVLFTAGMGLTLLIPGLGWILGGIRIAIPALKVLYTAMLGYLTLEEQNHYEARFKELDDITDDRLGQKKARGIGEDLLKTAQAKLRG